MITLYQAASQASKEDLEKLAKEIRKDPGASTPAEKRVKLETTPKIASSSSLT